MLLFIYSLIMLITQIAQGATFSNQVEFNPLGL